MQATVNIRGCSPLASNSTLAFCRRQPFVVDALGCDCGQDDVYLPATHTLLLTLRAVLANRNTIQTLTGRNVQIVRIVPQVNIFFATVLK